MMTNRYLEKIAGVGKPLMSASVDQIARGAMKKMLSARSPAEAHYLNKKMGKAVFSKIPEGSAKQKALVEASKRSFSKLSPQQVEKIHNFEL